jgi:hypothetical protein
VEGVQGLAGCGGGGVAGRGGGVVFLKVFGRGLRLVLGWCSM